MGNHFSQPKDLDTFANGITEGPNLRVNQNIVKFCSSDSSKNLKIHYEKRRMEAGDCAADWIKNLAEKVTGLLPSPELMGLGALAIAVFIDILSFSPPEESTKEALRSVFAEEKASEVWDQIDFCLTEYMTYINNKEQLRSKLKQIEPRLGEALIKLKNSVVRDKQMSNDALKAWVNGAAFHIEMLIQLVRLGDTQTFDHVERRHSIYQNDLEALLVKHKEMVENKCSYYHSSNPHHGLESYGMKEEDGKYHRLHINYHCSFKDFFEAYYDRRYSRQMSEIQEYFSNAGRNLQSRVNQRGFFTVE